MQHKLYKAKAKEADARGRRGDEWVPVPFPIPIPISVLIPILPACSARQVRGVVPPFRHYHMPSFWASVAGLHGATYFT